MKSMTHPGRILKLAAITSTLALAATLSLHASARGGAEGLLQSRQAPSPAVETAAPATACTDCKDVLVTRTTGVKGAQMLAGRAGAKTVHACPECRTAWTVSGHGKTATASARHLCAACQTGRSR